jgi:hypothetical protein
VRGISTFLLTFLLASGAVAHAQPGVLVGVTEDGVKFEPQAAAEDARELGIGAFRITLRWRPGLTAPTALQAAELQRATDGASGITILLSVFGERAVHAPTTEGRRDEYCGFLGSIVRRFDRIRHLAIWNEPNKTFFWRPQFNPDGTSAAPGAYAALLARCWDVLHAARPDVQVVALSTSPRGNDNPNAVSNISHSPTLFARELGRAYRESARDEPMFDIVGHHVHALHSAERPWRTHPGSTVTQADLPKLEQALSEAFAGTAQPVPGRCVEGKCVPVWFIEAGFQTVPDEDKTSLYEGVEVTPRSLPDSTGEVDLEPLPDSRSLAPDQATQVVSALRLAYCQPHVEAFFNFLLWDEQRLEGWQSAPMWVDRTPKGSFDAFRETIRELSERDVECDELRRELAGATDPAGIVALPSPETDSSSPWRAAAAAAGGVLLAAIGLVYVLRRRGRAKAA